jgi:hypothetical protein
MPKHTNKRQQRHQHTTTNNNEEGEYTSLKNWLQQLLRMAGRSIWWHKHELYELEAIDASSGAQSGVCLTSSTTSIHRYKKYPSKKEVHGGHR